MDYAPLLRVKGTSRGIIFPHCATETSFTLFLGGARKIKVGVSIADFRLHHHNLQIAQVARGEAGIASRWTGANYGNTTFNHVLHSLILEFFILH